MLDTIDRTPAVTISFGENGAVKRKKPKIEATPEQKAAAKARKQKHAETLALMKAESAKLRESRADAEQKRVGDVKAGKAKRAKSRLSVTVTTENGKSRTTKRIKTTTDKMLNNGTLQKYLKKALDTFCLMVGDGLGVAVAEGDEATSRMIASYEAFNSGSGFRSRTLSDRQLDGLTAYRIMESRIPAELEPIFRQIVFEEVGASLAVPMTLTEMGEKAGYTWRQASASGGTQICCCLMLIHHFLKEKGWNGK
jgi:hypothetical protein